MTGPIKEEIIEFRGKHRLWREDWHEFVVAISEGRELLGSGGEGLQPLQLVQ